MVINSSTTAAVSSAASSIQVMVEKLTPERLEQEYSLGPDAPQIAFRKLRQEWIDMGYGVPPETVRPRRGLTPDM
jgi:hypothetical protein